MTPRLVGVLVAGLWISAVAHGAEAPTNRPAAVTAVDATPAPPAAATPAPSPTPMSRVTRELQNRQLELPSYARYGVDPFAGAPDVPSFSEEVEVFGKPMDTEALTAKMAWWMSDFEPMQGSIGGAHFYAPTLAEMRDHRPSPTQAADFKPLLGWLLGKLTKKDGDKK